MRYGKEVGVGVGVWGGGGGERCLYNYSKIKWFSF